MKQDIAVDLKTNRMLELRERFYLKKTDWPSIIDYASLCIDFLTANSIKVNVN